jgi:diaminohydroxyphosphoribosylaminopyrimidine deaminase/5-amino-6-(5-phosphoribosylamino)uracil reductase
MIRASPQGRLRTLRQPTRVVFDSEARLPLNSRLVETIGQAPLVVVASPAAPRAAHRRRSGMRAARPWWLVGDPPPIGSRRSPGAWEPRLHQPPSRGRPDPRRGLSAPEEIDELRLFIAPDRGRRDAGPPPDRRQRGR